MENNRKPADFAWVKVRHACSIQQMFEELKFAIKQDAEAVSEMLKNDAPPRRFKILERSKFIKVYEENPYAEETPAIMFTLSGKIIQVADGATNTGIFDVTIGLNDDGDCKFMLNGKERDSWQIRRQALEPLFFRA